MLCLHLAKRGSTIFFGNPKEFGEFGDPTASAQTHCMDNAKFHRPKAFKAATRATNAMGCTPCCQTLDVSTNKPMISMVAFQEKSYNDDYEYTSSDRRIIFTKAVGHAVRQSRKDCGRPIVSVQGHLSFPLWRRVPRNFNQKRPRLPSQGSVRDPNRVI
ncbi:hypothetical protein K470DRAFT_287478 [Piedraia hortae CBS 480.64]|uniref:Uncharacterized protein n=1 Tax=Piedraia hortae CBS 480.64 TaxID=1314780 RepID=A0A6A7BYU2_9PEZI|nr:hypothetical protein K470DRAFT_287478 [Piedraia hortae CBS 480.64]